METRYLYQDVFLNCFSILVFWIPVYLDITISTRLIGHWTPGIQLPMLPTLGLQAYAIMLGFYMGAEVLNQILTFWHQAFYPLINLFSSIFNHFLLISSSSFIRFYHNIFRKYCRVFIRKQEEGEWVSEYQLSNQWLSSTDSDDRWSIQWKIHSIELYNPNSMIVRTLVTRARAIAYNRMGSERTISLGMVSRESLLSTPVH